MIKRVPDHVRFVTGPNLIIERYRLSLNVFHGICRPDGSDGRPCKVRNLQISCYWPYAELRPATEMLAHKSLELAVKTVARWAGIEYKGRIYS